MSASRTTVSRKVEHREFSASPPPVLSQTDATLTNWSMTAHSHCSLWQASHADEILAALTSARARGVSIIPHGAGHSYSDAALNTDGIVLDLSGMRRILAWDASRGIMRVEPGVTLREVVRVAMPAGWWPPVTPSTADVTIGGCVAMNVTGKNAWHMGSFGEHVLALTVLLTTGTLMELTPERDPQLFYALVGSVGLLGIITAITLRLRPITAAAIESRSQPSTDLAATLALMRNTTAADAHEAWIDASADGRHVGRGIVTTLRASNRDNPASLRQLPRTRSPDAFMVEAVRWLGTIGRPIAGRGIAIANQLAYHWGLQRAAMSSGSPGGWQSRSLWASTFFPPAAFAGYQALLPHGIETLHAFIPNEHIEQYARTVLTRSQACGHVPVWSVLKQHRADPFLLSYQVNGFSIEANYRIVPATRPALRELLRELGILAIAHGGRLYHAKDALLTHELYRQSIGDAAVDAFLRMKRMLDPDDLLQSDLYRRVFCADSATQRERV